MKSKNKGFKVSARNIKNIRSVAHQVKDILIKVIDIKGDKFPIVEVIELLQHREIIDLEIVEVEEMPDEYGLSFPNRALIQIREDIYEKAVNGDAFGRSTMAHELGHYFLHKKETGYARSTGGNHKTIEDSEWQANKFAQELLVDVRDIDPELTHFDIEIKYGVSGKSSRVACESLRREGVLISTPSKRGTKISK